MNDKETDFIGQKTSYLRGFVNKVIEVMEPLQWLRPIRAKGVAKIMQAVHGMKIKTCTQLFQLT